MSIKLVVLISPPFSSQMLATIELATAFRAEGVEAYVASSESFRERVEERGLGFVRLVTSSNTNTKVARKTRQPVEDKKRLDDFLAATKRGPLDALLVQTRDRKRDMLYDPEGTIDAVRRIQEKLKPGLWVSNQLSYASTLALYCLGLPFVSLCLPHPGTVHSGTKVYGVPSAWPKKFEIDAVELGKLRAVAREVEREFTAEFNRIIARFPRSPGPVRNALSLTSPYAVLFNYPDFKAARTLPGGPFRIFMGHCFREEALDGPHRKLLETSGSRRPRILIVFGTFLSDRDEVIERCVTSCKLFFPGSLVIAGCGVHAERIGRLPYEGLMAEEFVPQKALMPHIDLIVHHGGSNSFSEALYYEVPMVILPFSSDQFDIALDAERHGIGAALPPNTFRTEEMGQALQTALHLKHDGGLRRWGRQLKGRGPLYAVRRLLSLDYSG